MIVSRTPLQRRPLQGKPRGAAKAFDIPPFKPEASARDFYIPPTIQTDFERW